MIRIRPASLWGFLALLSLIAGCAHGPSSADARGLLRLEVDPPDATLYVDDDYMGTIDGWRGQTLRLPLGVRMVEVRATGYITQRFDVEIEPNVEVTLRLSMEPELDTIDLDDATDSG